jgi:cell wall-associated NlpC family hydrolase
MTPDNVVSAARLALGTPFKHQGRTVGKGLDCAGLLAHVCAAHDQPVIEQPGYARHPSGGLLEAALDAQPALVRVRGMPQAGDFVLMKFETDSAPSHLGIVAGKTLIHAWAIARKVCEHDFAAEWQGRVVRVYRFRELNNGE